MSDMSFKQAKELTEQFELAELTLQQTLKKIDMASKNFDRSLIKQEKVLRFMPEANEKLNMMKVIVALNIGFVIGLMVSKYLF
ncbi:MAG: hypothetical protein U9N59_07460 [Campylobacterota bacterium]|nr:hypothetical protein [Campylobacterota bacterium]